MKIKLEPINDTNRETVLALTVREDQPFVAPNIKNEVHGKYQEDI